MEITYIFLSFSIGSSTDVISIIILLFYAYHLLFNLVVTGLFIPGGLFSRYRQEDHDTRPRDG